MTAWAGPRPSVPLLLLLHLFLLPRGQARAVLLTPWPERSRPSGPRPRHNSESVVENRTLPTVEGRVFSNVQRQRQSPRQLQYSIAIINIIAIMSMIASPPSGPSAPHRHHGHHRLIATMAIIASSPPWPSSPHRHHGHQRLIVSIARIAMIARPVSRPVIDRNQ